MIYFVKKFIMVMGFILFLKNTWARLVSFLQMVCGQGIFEPNPPGKALEGCGKFVLLRHDHGRRMFRNGHFDFSGINNFSVCSIRAVIPFLLQNIKQIGKI